MSLLAVIFFRKESKYPVLFGVLSFFFLTLGGLILGLFVQKFAFQVYWAGFPFAWDLTDNKTLIAFLIWLVALLLNIKKYRPIYLVIAVLMIFVVFSIPHSMNGSERNPQTGEIEYR